MSCECDVYHKTGFCAVKGHGGEMLAGNYTLSALLTGKMEVFSGLKLVIEVHGHYFEHDMRCSYAICYESLLSGISKKMAREGLTLWEEGLLQEFCPTEQGLDEGI